MSTPNEEHHRDARQGEERNAEGGRAAGGASALIALIEDDDDNREALSYLLQTAGYQVNAYSRADYALEAMESGHRPDLVILDLMMPGMNGWQFRVEQRRRPTLASIPIVALSGNRSPYAAAMDADAYLEKPVTFERLCTVVAQLLLVSERRMLATRTVEYERIRSLGMVVAGVAHEINNPLNYVLGNLELLDERAKELSRAPERTREVVPQLLSGIDAARDGAQRVASIVRLLSAFVRKEQKLQNVDPLHALEAAVRLSRQQIRSRARLVCQLEPLPTVRANEAQLAQVFLNLLINAADAIPEGAVDENEIRVRSFRAGDMAVVEVEDTGCGIAAELASRVFEAFYTTKGEGRGTGLGLSISRDIVTSFGGRIGLRSQLGQGTTFRVELPSAELSGGQPGAGGDAADPRGASAPPSPDPRKSPEEPSETLAHRSQDERAAVVIGETSHGRAARSRTCRAHSTPHVPWRLSPRAPACGRRKTRLRSRTSPISR